MKNAKKFIVTVLAIVISFSCIVSNPAGRLQAYAASNYMKKNNIRTNLQLGKTVTVQSYCAGVGLRNSKVRVLEFEKEAVKDKPGYECAYVKIRISTPKLKNKQVVKALKAANKLGIGNYITQSYNAVMIDGKNGMSVGSFLPVIGEVDGVYTLCGMDYSGFFEQKAAGYDIEGYKDLTYDFAVIYKKSRKNLYVGIAGTKNANLIDYGYFESRSCKFAKCNMYSKKNPKLSAFLRIN